MQKLNNISINDYNYTLPEDKIAKYPLGERDSSKLLICRNGGIKKDLFRNITDYLNKDHTLIFNNTKVIRARILFTKKTGANIEIFCLEPMNPSEYNLSFQSRSICVWKCIVGNLKKWKSGNLIKEITIGNQNINLKAVKLKSPNSGHIIEFSWESNHTFSEVIEAAGIIPIPPYLNRSTEKSDVSNYQTIYSKVKGSVAAPTAGLHFSDHVFKALRKKNINYHELTLHVGAGTFKPVQTNSIEEHEMHAEHFTINKKLIKDLISKKNKIIAVGTTSVRTLESIYWLGVKLIQNKNKNIPFISQWDGFEAEAQFSARDALESLGNYMDAKNWETINTATQILIAPGYKFRVIDGLITNFHLPKSTLLLLIAAMVGDDWKNIYRYALENDFRFLSYGDSSLLLP